MRRALESQGKMSSVPQAARPRVMLGVPSMDSVKAKFATSWAALCAFSARYCDLVIVNEENSVIHQGRNRLVRAAQEHAVGYLLFLDADMVFPPDALMRLLSHNKDMTCAFYNRRCAPYTTVGALVDPKADLTRPGLVEASMAGCGLMLIRMDVFARTSAPWFFWSSNPADAKPDNLDGETGEDVNFIIKARAAGFKLWADLDLTFDPRVGHVGDNIVRCSPKPAQAMSA